MARILITGGAGFVGGQLAFRLQRGANEVVVLDNLVRRGSELNLRRFREAGITFVHGDVRNPEDFHRLPGGFDVILETSAQPSATAGYANPVYDVTNNTVGLLHVLEFARAQGAGVVFWSTNKVYGADVVNAIPRREEATRWVWDTDALAAAFPSGLPVGFDPAYGFSESLPIDGGRHSIYGLSKVMADLACQEYADAFELPIVVNRCSCLAGEGQFGQSEQGWVAWWAIAAHFGLPLTYYGWNGKQVRDVLFIDDLARLVELEISNLRRLRGQVFNVGGGLKHTLSLREVTVLVESLCGRRISAGEVRDPRKADHCIYASDIRKVQGALDWEPRTTVEKGLDRLVQWVRANEAELKGLQSTATTGPLRAMIR